MTGTTTAPDTLKDVYARYREIAPEPDPESTDPSKAAAVRLLVHAQRGFTRMLNPDMVSEVCAQFAFVHLLLWLRENQPEAAARLAREITDAWNDGGGIGEWLWEHAQSLGIDTSEVAALATAEARLRAAQTATEASTPVYLATIAHLAGALRDIRDANPVAPAGGYARDRASLALGTIPPGVTMGAAHSVDRAAMRADAVQTLGGIVTELSRGLYAAWIDLQRGDHGRVLRWVADMPAELRHREGDDAWNGTETGERWLHRTQPDPESAARVLAARAHVTAAGARELAHALSFQARTLYAAWIDIARGDRDSAVRWIVNAQPDQWDGEPWNGTETGERWLARTEPVSTP
jgi:hypothetical protein